MIDFRKIKPEDELFLIDLYGSTREDVMLHGGHLSREQKHDFICQQYTLQQAHYKKNNPKAFFLIITLEGKDVGRLTYSYSDNKLWIIEFSLTPQTRGKGVGKEVIQYLEAKYSKGLMSIGLYVLKTNAKAKRFYQSLDFNFQESNFELFDKCVKYIKPEEVCSNI